MGCQRRPAKPECASLAAYRRYESVESFSYTPGSETLLSRRHRCPLSPPVQRRSRDLVERPFWRLAAVWAQGAGWAVVANIMTEERYAHHERHHLRSFSRPRHQRSVAALFVEQFEEFSPAPGPLGAQVTSGRAGNVARVHRAPTGPCWTRGVRRACVGRGCVLRACVLAARVASSLAGLLAR